MCVYFTLRDACYSENDIDNVWIVSRCVAIRGQWSVCTITWNGHAQTRHRAVLSQSKRGFSRLPSWIWMHTSPKDIISMALLPIALHDPNTRYAVKTQPIRNVHRWHRRTERNLHPWHRRTENFTWTYIYSQLSSFRHAIHRKRHCQ